ncbi:MAG: hypothetical protein HY730_08275 [Candidatus Tectomicrobia bacterium]|uniref:Prenylated flavin chaperone LpdD-like domain-containing protein n=1 Tax=Tectimicrobiota bacterium TaxID=2528274 RepID=A0A933LQP4_UNCTE|nr:hypothetical protein [Candidatus Tectomicrobia bacterium]
MDKYEVTTGEGRTQVNLFAYHLGSDLMVCIHNENAHIGAVAIGDYDHRENRASCSVITRLGHKDDVIAMETAHTICKAAKRPVCVVAGIHVDKITANEIDAILKNTKSLVAQFCVALGI